MNQDMIAPCGMNCGTCIYYIFASKDLNKAGFHKTYCPGCVKRGQGCTYAMSKKCDKIKNATIRFCYECETFPCKGLKHLDTRYKTKYNMSMIQNLQDIKTIGMQAFLLQQQAKYTCPNCGDIKCTHNGLCLGCNLDALKSRKKTS